MSTSTANFHLSDTKNQIWVSFIATIFFIVVTLPMTYKFTNQTLKPLTGISLVDNNNAPTTSGVIIHSIVFFILFWIYLALVTTALPNGY